MTLRLRLADAAGDVPAADWDRLAGTANPFARHAFFTSLEESGSATAETGWRPLHLVAEDEAGRVHGILPGYLKSHSQGEYVFDHGWADAWMRAGHRYYPKLQHSTPFTPATAPKLLAEDEETRALLVAASEALARKNGLSSAHATFLTDADADSFAARGWLERNDLQYHWRNDGGWRSFDDYLGAFSSRKRKVLHHERRQALAAVDSVDWLTAGDLTEAVWGRFFAFYQDTGSRKWGHPYLTRPFFSLIGQRMGERVLLVLAKRGGEYVAGALNFIGADCLYGRQWGALEDIPFLHFELCYHQAIDFACRHGLSRIEAGAQGAHKIARGYRPVPTRSMHYLPDPGFRAAVADYLAEERPALAEERAALARELPFRADG